MPHGTRIAPCLWFDHQAEEAATFYTAVFKNSNVSMVTRYAEAGREIHGQPAGTVMAVAFALDGQPFTALNGGPLFTLEQAYAGSPGQPASQTGIRWLAGRAT